MSSLHIVVEPFSVRFAFEGVSFVAPVGPHGLAEHALGDDPPRPEELTNAIGTMTDHLDDLVRETPGSLGADVVIDGAEMRAIAAVEAGRDPDLPMVLSRDAVEDVFRTLATETAADRRHNPGLRPDLVATVVGGCCIVVAIMRRLHLDAITVAR
jgi:exopolyphosphatase/guanosine-5'-triphosphate,3'-diphosphate pyrophosphatase